MKEWDGYNLLNKVKVCLLGQDDSKQILLWKLDTIAVTSNKQKENEIDIRNLCFQGIDSETNIEFWSMKPDLTTKKSAVTNHFYRNVQIGVLCFTLDAPKGLIELADFIDTVESLSKSFPLILLYGATLEKSMRVISSDEALSYAKILSQKINKNIPYLETTGSILQKIFETL